VLMVIVAPDTISALTLNVMGKDYHWFPSAYFIHRNDSVEFWKAYPRPPDVPADRTQKLDDSLAFRFTIRSTEELRKVVNVLGELPDSSLGTPITTRATFRQLMQISNLGIKVTNLDIYRDGEDTTEYRGGLRIREQKQPSSQDRDKKAPGSGSGSAGVSVRRTA